jgi:hypothetical protein
MITAGSDVWAILGLPFFSSYHITVDRTIGTMKFELGCGCESSIDGFPKIVAGNNSIASTRISGTKPINISPALVFLNFLLVLILL